MDEYDPSELAARFRRAGDEFVAFLESLDETSWSKATDREGWPIGVVAHHIAMGAQFCGDLAVHVAGGGDIGLTQELLDQSNSQHAEMFVEIGRDSALEALSRTLPEAAKKIESLPADSLHRKLEEPKDFGEGVVRFAGDVVEKMLINHIHIHMASIKEAVSGG